MKKKLKKYIEWAGGPSMVARTMKLSRTTVWHWQVVGFPDTDFSGKTQHAKHLAKMCKSNGYSVTQQQVLQAGRP